MLICQRQMQYLTLTLLCNWMFINFSVGALEINLCTLQTWKSTFQFVPLEVVDEFPIRALNKCEVVKHNQDVLTQPVVNATEKKNGFSLELFGTNYKEP